MSVHRASWVWVMLVGAAAPCLAAQSLTSGSLSGAVRGPGDALIRDALVTLTNRNGGAHHSMTTRANGEFSFPLLAPGTYEVLVEHLAYRPKRVRGIPIPMGVAVRTSVILQPGPADTVDVEEFPATLAGRAPAFVDRLSMAAFGPDLRRDAVDLTRRSSALSVAPWSDGLPSSLNGVYWDGVALPASHHPSYAAAEQPLTPPLGSVGSAEVVLNGTDVEWHGAAGPILSTQSNRGTGKLRLDVTADGTSSALTSSQYFDPGVVSGTSFRTNATLSGPLIRDSAEFVLGVDVQRLEQPRAALWPTNALSSALVDVAQDSFAVDLSPYTQPGISHTAATSVFGRFDWRAVRNSTLSVRGLIADVNTDLDALGARSTGLGAVLDGRDYSGLLALSSILAPSVTQELRVSFTGSRRDYQSADVAPTRIVDAGLSFGGDPSLVADMHRSTFQVADAVHFAFPNHRIKVGGTFAYSSFENTFADESDGAFAFAGTGEFTANRGVFRQTVGPTPLAKFKSLDFGGFLQDRWSAAPGLDVLFGLRFDSEDLPQDEIRPNDSLIDITGLNNAAVPGHLLKWSPRFGMRWDVGDRGAWVVTAAAGLYYSSVDPGLVTELITGDGGVRGRRGLGDLGGWPGAPDSTVAPVIGSRMTLLGPDFEAPRSSRVGFSLSHAVGLTALHLSAAYRHTDFLPRRTDLNRLPAPSGVDQYGRPLYGTIVQQGSLLTSQANQRFTTFDRIWAVNADGYSDYLGLTATLTREAIAGARFLASYTYSQTTDNWLGGRGGSFASQLSPFPDSIGGVDWTDDRSDYDVPHRVVLGLELPIGPLTLGGLYRYESGAPFTPGFRPGVDANGDGADDNDPVFVDDAIAGVTDVFAEWDCLSTQVGAFAARNSCREPGSHRLDVRLSLTPFRIGGTPVHVVLDGLNLVESDVGLRDHALYLVDRTGTVTTNPGTGVTTVPLIVNPAFGNVLARRTTGLVLRLGVRWGGGLWLAHVSGWA